VGVTRNSLTVRVWYESENLSRTGKCSDVTGEIAASLAHAAVTFADMPNISAEYWKKAKMAYQQTGVATKSWGNSNTVFADLGIYYASSGLVSHVFFGAASMYTACKVLKCPEEKQYMDDVMALGSMKEPDGGQKWFWEVPGWDNAWWDGAALMASQGVAGPPIFGKPAFTEFLGVFADKWVNGKAPITCEPACRHCASGAMMMKFRLNTSGTQNQMTH
jgi:hypothetical protein